MDAPSRSEQIPLPFATAAIGLCLSYLFRGHVGSITATLAGFAVGIVALYFLGHSSREKSVTFLTLEEPTKCPTCGEGDDAYWKRNRDSSEVIVAIKGL